MAFQVKFKTGQTATFANRPSDKDIDEVASRLKPQAPQPTAQPTAQTQPKPKARGLSGFDKFLKKGAKVADVLFGAGKVGEAIGTQIAKATVPKEQKEFVSKGPSAKEVVGSAAKSALLFAPVGRGAKLATTGIKALGVKKGAGALGKIAIGAGVGAGFDVASGLERGESIKEAIKPGVGAVIGGGIPIAGKAVSGIASTLSKSLPERLVTSALKLTPKEAGRVSGKKAVDTILSGKRVGTANKLLKDAQGGVKTLGSQIDIALRKVPKARVSKAEIAKLVKTNKFFEEAGLTSSEVIKEVTRLIPRARRLIQKKTLTLKEANRLRQIIDETLGDTFFHQANPTFSKDLLNTFSRTLSDTVKKKGPKGTDKLFAELSKEISLRNALLNTTTRGKGNQIISFGDLIGGTLGLAGGLPGVVAGIAGRRIAGSTPVKTGAAQAARGLGRGISRAQRLETGGAGRKLLLGNLPTSNQ